jgi:hypothetical protein
MAQWKSLRRKKMDAAEPGNGMRITARIEISLLENGQMVYKTQVPNRFIFNAMMETCKQNSLADLMKGEQQKVVLPELNMSRVKI